MKRLRRWMRFQAARGSVALINLLPRTVALALMGVLGWLAYHTMPRQRRLVRRQIDRVYPQLSPAWRRSLSRQVFVALGRSAADFARLARPRPGWLLDAVEVADRRRLSWMRSRGRGMVVVAAHYGSWEILPSILAAFGCPVLAVVKPNREERIERLLSRLRTGLGVRLVPRTCDARALRRALRSGAIVMITGDQTPRGRRLAGRFLGLPAWIPAGPAALAVLSGVPLMTVILRRGQGGRHELVLGDPMSAPADLDRRSAIEELARRSSEELEREIARDPSQWAWFHERWKSIPSEPPPPPGRPDRLLLRSAPG